MCGGGGRCSVCCFLASLCLKKEVPQATTHVTTSVWVLFMPTSSSHHVHSRRELETFLEKCSLIVILCTKKPPLYDSTLDPSVLPGQPMTLRDEETKTKADCITCLGLFVVPVSTLKASQ